MSFLSDVVQPNQLSNINSKPVVSGGFLSSVIKPQQANTQQQNKPSIIENPKGDGYPALNPDGSQVTPNAPVSDPFGVSRIQNSPLSKGVDAISDYLKTNKILTPPKSTIESRAASGDIIAKTIQDSHTQFWDSLHNAVDTWKSSTSTPLQKGLASGETALAGANTIFSIPSGILQGMEAVPGLQYPAHAINTIFGAAGVGGSAAASQAVKNIPDNILSPETKTAITPLASQLGGLAAQIAVGKGGEMAKSDVVKLSKQIIDHVKNEPINIPVSSESTPNAIPIDKSFFNKTEPQVLSNAQETKIPISTPVSRAVDYNKKMGYEPITPTEQLPTIQVGKNKSELPTIQTVPKESTQLGSYKYEPIKETRNAVKGGFLDSVDKSEVTPKIETTKTSLTTEFGRTPKEVTPTPISNATDSYGKTIKSPIGSKTASQPSVISKTVETTPKTIKETDLSTQKQSKVGTSIETKSIEKGLTQGFGDTAGYDPITIKDQAERASKLMNEDIQKARDMVTGKIPMESGLKGEMLIKAMEDHAEKTGNVDLMRDIAKSPLVSETSAHAQAMRILAERNPDSVVAKLNEIKKAREASVEKKTGKKISEHTKETVKEIKQSMKVTVPKKEDWNSFIKSIQC